MGQKSSKEEDFNFWVSGPSHLINTVDWRDEDHRRAVVACLVKGAYTLEFDRQKKRGLYSGQALAPPWWRSFHFELYRDPFIDEKDNSIFGAIYKFNGPPAASTPKYVIAFRGTLTKKKSIKQDMKNNVKIILNKYHTTTRFNTAMKHFYDSLQEDADNNNVWLAGHSQGSATALLLGKRLITEKKIHFETFLFNPFFIPSPLNSSTSNETSQKVRPSHWMPGMRHVRSYAKAVFGGIASYVSNRKRLHDDEFVDLSNWIPNLFVNPRDDICKGYINYFEDRVTMEDLGAGKIARMAANTSFRSLISYLLGRETDPFHLIPSAYLTINNCGSNCTDDSAHALQQWWNRSCQPQSTMYTWKSCPVIGASNSSGSRLINQDPTLRFMLNLNYNNNDAHQPDSNCDAYGFYVKMPQNVRVHVNLHPPDHPLTLEYYSSPGNVTVT